ncbi:MAG: tetratricopeptide repeat protein, partial [Nitrososphaerales archaeon]
ALSSAIEIQDAISKYRLHAPSSGSIQIRIGIHVGDVLHSEGDVYGDAVNIASRIASNAAPDAIWVSRQVADQVTNKGDMQLASIGNYELKGLPESLELYSVVLPRYVADRTMHARAGNDARSRDADRLGVLPLVNMSADPADEYFADGLTEEIIGTLSSISGLRVIARASMMRYKGAKKSVREIGRELGVRSLLDGSVRRADSRVRISVQLVDAQSEEHLWSRSYDKLLEDVFAIQSQIAKSVAESLKITLKAIETERIDRKGTASVEAHNFYLKGRFHQNKRTEEDLKKAISLFENATKSDPEFALAFAGLSDSYCLLGIYGTLSPGEARKPASEYATRAIELDETLAEAHTSLAHTLYHYEWSWVSSEREFKKALELNPNYSPAHHWYSEYLGSMGRMEQALVEIRIAQELDPLSSIISTHAGFILYASGDYDGAIEQLGKVIELDRSFPPAHEVLGAVYAEQGKINEARIEIRKAIELSGDNPGLKATLAYSYAKCGRREEALKILDEIKNLHDQYVSPDSIAQALSGLGEREEAFDFLEKAYSTRSSKIVNLRIEPAFYNLHSDPRFSQLLKKMSLI